MNARAFLSITNSWSLFKLMSIESVMPSIRLILCRPLFLPSVFPSIRVFSSELTVRKRIPGTLPVDKLSFSPYMPTYSSFLHFPRRTHLCLEKNLKVANLLLPPNLSTGHPSPLGSWETLEEGRLLGVLNHPRCRHIHCTLGSGPPLVSCPGSSFGVSSHLSVTPGAPGSLLRNCQW